MKNSVFRNRLKAPIFAKILIYFYQNGWTRLFTIFRCVRLLKISVLVQDIQVGKTPVC